MEGGGINDQMDANAINSGTFNGAGQFIPGMFYLGIFLGLPGGSAPSARAVR
jgi:hypothetical protein